MVSTLQYTKQDFAKAHWSAQRLSGSTDRLSGGSTLLHDASIVYGGLDGSVLYHFT
jgi:hypothetical protein